MISPREIQEENILEIELRNQMEHINPDGLWAKWFQDSLGQLWVKYREVCPGGTRSIVVPSDRVAAVRYLSELDPPKKEEVIPMKPTTTTV